MNRYIFNDLNEFTEIETRLSLSECLIDNHKYYLNYQRYRLRMPSNYKLYDDISYEIKNRHTKKVDKLWRAENGYYLPKWCIAISNKSGKIVYPDKREFYEILQETYGHLGWYKFIYKNGPEIPY